MNRRKNEKEYDVHAQQVHLAKVFRIMKLIGIGLALISTVCVAVALHYTL